MPSRCYAIGESRATRVRAGFTLLELVVVIALIGLMAGMVGARVAATSAIALERDALQAIASVLSTARVESMRTGQGQCAAVTVENGTFAIASPGVRRATESRGLIAIDEQVEPQEHFEACFDAAGRTAQRVWWFTSSEVNRTELLNADLLRAPWAENADALRRDVRGQVWRIVFDPVSGAPRVERVDGTSEGDAQR